ncbi:MAG: hypothetical protein Q9162_001255 [Coniocarpon cinnabarinum]
MALETVTNQAPKSSSRRRNKKSTAEAKVEPAPEPETPPQAPTIEEEDARADGGDAAFENPHIKELHKNIRNVNKKLTGMAKVDAIVAEHPNKSLDNLVADRKINADQKAQIMKKPILQAQLKDFEDQVALHKKIEEDFAKRLQAQKLQLQAQHEKELDEAKEAAAIAATPTSAPEQQPSQLDLRTSLLTLSRFLRAAAARRQESDDTSADTQGFEGVLLLLYGGDNAAVDAAEKLISGSSDLVPSTEGGETTVNYGRVKQLATEYAPFASEEAWVDGVADANATSDPTITNAGLTELSSTPAAPAPATSAGPSTLGGTSTTASVEPAAGNAASVQPSEQLEQSWVSVPRAPEETETHNAAVAAAVPTNTTENWSSEPAAAGTTPQDLGPIPASTFADPEATNIPTMTTTANDTLEKTESWADSAPDIPITTNGDGFHEVHHGRFTRGGRGGFDGRGGYDGRGRGRGNFRGDRGRGDFRGRGRGGFEGRGGRGRGRGREAGAPSV